MVNFVILGCPRSGTTLLATLLEKYFDVAAPIEPHIVEYFGRYRWMFPGRLTTSQKALLVNSIFRFLKIWLPRNNPSRDMQSVIPYSLLATESEKSRLIDTGKDFDSTVRAFFDLYTRKHGTSGWVDKSAYYFPPDITTIGEIFCDAKFIHIKRNPYDTCASWHKSWFGPPHVLEAGRLWKKHIEAINSWSEQNPDRLLEITYEELTLNPDKTLNLISAFAGENIHKKEAPSTQMSSVLSTGGTHDNLTSEVIHSPEKWKAIYSEKNTRALAFITQPGKSVHNSSLAEYSRTERVIIRARQLFWLTRSQFIRKVIYRKIKYLLPGFCFTVELVRAMGAKIK